MSTTADRPPHDSVLASGAVAPVGPVGAPSVPAADQFMRRLLRLDAGATSTAAEARSAFQKSLLISTCRCLLMYIVFPFVLPAVGVARGVGPLIGLTIGLLAMVSIVYSIRRFWRADHSKRWHYTIFGTVIIGFLIYLAAKDIVTLIS
jgi:formate hydrogenlyase subunit 3/multisubunit Na+/H+ antiporter MnhD subunit